MTRKRLALILCAAAAVAVPPAWAAYDPQSAARVWTALQTFTAGILSTTGVFSGGQSVVSPRNNATVQIIAPNADGAETTTLDIFAYTEPSEMALERYDCTAVVAGFCTGYKAISSGETIGDYMVAALDGTPGSPGVGDPTDGVLGFVATENFSTTAQGTGAGIWLNPNGSTNLALVIGFSPQGHGGVTIGGGNAIDSGPPDLGNGTLHAKDDIVTDSHLKTKSTTYGQPSVTTGGCGGTGANVAEGTDNAALVQVGSGGATTCLVTFGHVWGTNNPICQAQAFNNTSIRALVSSWTNNTVTVTFTGSYTGLFTVLCLGANS